MAGAVTAEQSVVLTCSLYGLEEDLRASCLPVLLCWDPRNHIIPVWLEEMQGCHSLKSSMSPVTVRQADTWRYTWSEVKAVDLLYLSCTHCVGRGGQLGRLHADLHGGNQGKVLQCV